MRKPPRRRRKPKSQAVIDFLENRVLSAARPEGYQGGLGHDVSLRRAIEAAVPFVQDGFKDQPLIEARLRMTLGRSFDRLGDSKKSGEQYAAVREIYTRHYGPDHELTLKSTLRLAARLNAIGRHVEACKMCESLVGQAQNLFGPDHEETLNAMDHLAECYNELGRFSDALPWRKRVLTLRQTKLGPDHAFTLISRFNLAGSFTLLGRRGESLAILESVLPPTRATFGRDDVNTVNCMNNLANEYQFFGRFPDAFNLREEVLAIRKANLGHDHPLTLMAMRNLAISHRLLNHRAEALGLSQEVRALTEKKFGPDHAETLDAMNSVATCYFALGRYEDCALRWERTRWHDARPSWARTTPTRFRAFTTLAFSFRLRANTLTPWPIMKSRSNCAGTNWGRRTRIRSRVSSM